MGDVRVPNPSILALAPPGDLHLPPAAPDPYKPVEWEMPEVGKRRKKRLVRRRS